MIEIVLHIMCINFHVQFYLGSFLNFCLLFKSAPMSNLLTGGPISIDQILKKFENYKLRVPVCGAIILNKALNKVKNL